MESKNKIFYTVVWLGSQRPTVEQETKLNEGDMVKHVLYFEDDEMNKCLKYLQLASNENILFVIIGMACNQIVLDEKTLTQFHNLHQVKTIYADAKYSSRHSSQLFPKMKPVSSQTVSLHVQAGLHAHAQVSEPFVFNTFDERSSLTMNGDFMHFQMLIDCFVLDDFPSKFIDNYSTFAKCKNEFIEECKEIYKNDALTLAKIEEFAHTYTSEQALSWYTRSSFLYTLVNRALRTNDTKLILIFRFFIIDLYKQLVEKHCEPLTGENEHYLSPVYHVYRGQLMPKYELNSIRKSLGNIISMKSFLSTSLDRQTALFFLGDSDDSSQPSLARVLIEIDLGMNNFCMNSQKPFANITEHSDFGEVEKEVLFMVGSYFRITEVRRGEKGIWYVRLATLEPFDDPLQHQSKWSLLYRHMQSSIHQLIIPGSDIGGILFQSGKFDQAHQHYTQLLQHLRKLVYVPEETEDDEEKEYKPPSRTENESGGLAGFFKDLISNNSDANKRDDFEYQKNMCTLLCYYVLGRITHEKGLFDHSVAYYNAVLERTQPSFLTYEQPNASVSHVLRALCRLGLGATYKLNGKFKLAFEFYTKALQMFKQAHDGYIDKFPGDANLTHVYKAHCLIGLGNLCLIEQKFERADEYYREALSLFDKYLPVGHPDQSRIRQKMANIVRIYRCKPATALEDYEDCLENYLRSLPSDHVDIARVYRDMARAYEQLPNELDKSLEYAKKAADLFEKGLPKEHTDNVTICIIIKRILRKQCLKK